MIELRSILAIVAMQSQLLAAMVLWFVILVLLYFLALMEDRESFYGPGPKTNWVNRYKWSAVPSTLFVFIILSFILARPLLVSMGGIVELPQMMVAEIKRYFETSQPRQKGMP